MLDILAIDWKLEGVSDDVNLSFNQFHDTVNQIIDKYMPLKKLIRNIKGNSNLGSQTVYSSRFQEKIDYIINIRKLRIILVNNISSANTKL